MKKKLAILMAMMMVMCFAFASCGGGGGEESQDLSDSKYVGVWVAETMSFGEESEDTEGGSWILTLKGDGTGTFFSRDDSDGTEETTDITWVLTDDGFKTKGDTKLTFTDEGDGIKTKLMGAEIHFVRDGEQSGGNEGSSEESETSDADNTYGYTGNDPVEAAVYKYLAEEVSASYQPPADAVSIPVVQIIDLDVDSDDGEAEVSGDFWVLNYTVEGDTLKCISGGAHPGKMELVKNGDVYVVEEFEVVEDGANYEPSAKDIFEERYDDFVQVSSDDTTREKVRAEIIANYVKANGLEVTKYQDEGWDPVDLAL
jgi:hypothetical protein